ncbi:hypothetical protein [Streptomyces sp. cmx-4-9]|uniref:hypothetical protein n=1 Tax=Streptomyces sp. cmx-4-9 TaxID=2790941 RepID=UPI00398084CD
MPDRYECTARIVESVMAEELPVPGSDDLVLAGFQQPPLTTIRLDLTPPAQVADAVHELIETGTTPPVPAVEAALVHRGTS